MFELLYKLFYCRVYDHDLGPRRLFTGKTTSHIWALADFSLEKPLRILGSCRLHILGSSQTFHFTCLGPRRIFTWETISPILGSLQNFNFSEISRTKTNVKFGFNPVGLFAQELGHLLYRIQNPITYPQCVHVCGGVAWGEGGS